MKKIIRFLAKISGVESDIRENLRHEIGSNLKWESYCFSKEDKTFQILTDFGNNIINGEAINGLDARKKHLGF